MQRDIEENESQAEKRRQQIEGRHRKRREKKHGREGDEGKAERVALVLGAV